VVGYVLLPGHHPEANCHYFLSLHTMYLILAVSLPTCNCRIQFVKFSLWMTTATTAVFTEAFHGFPHPLQAIILRLDHRHFPVSIP
jgi:hypothetical protein